MNSYFPENSYVFTEHGYTPIQNIIPGVKVLTHTGTWHKVTNRITKFDNTLKIRGHHSGISCSPNTNIYIVDKLYIHEPKPIIWTPASNLTNQQLWATPRYLESLNFEQFYKYKGLFTVARLYIYGCYIRSGWIDNKSNIYIASSQKQYNNIDKYLQKLTNHYRVSRHNENKNSYVFMFRDDELCEFFKQHFGTNKISKRVPIWVYFLSYNQRNKILNGIIDNRYIHPTLGLRVVITNKQVLYSVRLLAELQNYISNIKLVNNNDNYNLCLKQSLESKTYTRDELHTWYKISKITANLKPELLYGLEVEQDHSYIINSIVVHD